MINGAAALGLTSNKSVVALKGIKSNLTKLLHMKTRDWKDEKRWRDEEREQMKRERQDLERLRKKQIQEYKEYSAIMGDGDNDLGFLDLLLGGGVLLMAVVKIGEFVVKYIKKLVKHIFDRFENWIRKTFKGKGGGWLMDRVRERLGLPKYGEAAEAAVDGQASAQKLDEAGSEALTMAEDDPNFKGLQPADIKVGERAGYSSRRGRNHYGRDIAAYAGTPLTSIGSGVVTQVGHEGGYGNYIVYRTKDGEHMYAHLQKPASKKRGDKVKAGDILGYIGSTGRSSGPHLHWEFDTKSGAVGYPLGAKRTQIIEPLEAGFKAQSPFTGLRKATGGAIGKSGAQNPKLTGNYKVAYDHIKRSFPEAKSHHIAAAMGNFDTEAPGLKPDTYQMNNGPGRGIAQWEIDTPKKLAKGIPGRWEYAEKKYGKGIINSLPQQLDYFAFEMKTGNPTVAETRKGHKIKGGDPLLPQGRNAPGMWLGANNLESATKGFMLGYEAPGKPHWDKRLKAAQGIHKQIKAEPTPNPFRNKPIGKQAGGVVEMRRAVGNPADMLTVNYNENFFDRQSRKRGAPIIVVHGGGGGGGGAVTAPSTPPGKSSPGYSGQATYGDVAHLYQRYMRGIKA